MRSRHCIKCVVGALALLIGFARVAVPNSSAAASPFSWITNQFSRGSAADLGDTNCETRMLDAAFLKDLLTTTKYPVPTFGVKIRNAVITNMLNLENAHVLPNVALIDCRFEDHVILSRCEFDKGLDLDGSVFLEDLEAEELEVRRSLQMNCSPTPAAFLTDSNALKSFPVFDPSVDPENVSPETVPAALVALLRKTNVEVASSAQMLRFSASGDYWALWDETNSYALWRASDSVQLFRVTSFFGDVNFHLASVGGNCEGMWAHFHGRTDPRQANGEPAQFKGLKVKGTLWFNGAAFWKNASFAYTVVDNQLSFVGACFIHRSNVADFYGLKVGGLADLDDARFSGPANFIQTIVRGNIEAQRTAFLNTDDLAAANRDFHHNADFGSLRVDGFAFFLGTRFDGEVSFKNANFQSLFFDEVRWPTSPERTNAVRLEWMRYERLRAADNFRIAESNRSDLQWQINHVQTWRNLKPVLAGRAPYSADVYKSLEKFFAEEGEPQLADDVFIEGRIQERARVLFQQWYHPELFKTSEHLRWTDWWPYVKAFARWLWNWLLRLLVGYGRHPEWALIPSFFFIFLGCRIFRREKMEVATPPGASPRNPEGRWRRFWFWKDNRYHAFWYSLDKFVPLIDFEANDKWLPLPSSRLAWNYLVVHRIAGAILVPIGFAAFSGIIK